MSAPIGDDDWPDGEVIGRDAERYGAVDVEMTYPRVERVAYSPDDTLRRIHLRGEPRHPMTTRSPEGAALQAAVDRVRVVLLRGGWAEDSPAMVSVVAAILGDG